MRALPRFSAALPGLLAALVTTAATLPPAPAAAADPPASKGVGMAAPVEAYDTLRVQVAPPPPASAPAPAPRAACAPLILDTNDFGFGASVVFDHMPGLRELGDLNELTSVRHVVVSLPDWPSGYEQVQVLAQAILPQDADLIVIVPGYPPSQAAAEAWNYLRLPLRLVVVVDRAPADRGVVDLLNRIRALERVIAQMQYPSRSGFERLQRPLSFRVVR